MKNKWLANAENAYFVFGGMTPAVMPVDLPLRYKIKSKGPTKLTSFPNCDMVYCSLQEDPNGEFVWKRRRVAEINGVEMKIMKKNPKYCDGRWTVFIVENE